MLTHVTDHLTKEQIPVRYIEDGQQSLVDRIVTIRELTLVSLAAIEELDLFNGANILDDHQNAHNRILGADEALSMELVDLERSGCGLILTQIVQDEIG